jgi:F0F1-type ATP synthase delta subunit
MDEVVVRSTFDVPEQWRGQLRETIRKSFGHHAEISYERTADLICGIELRVGGYSFAWNAHEFLKRAEQDFQERSKGIST